MNIGYTRSVVNGNFNADSLGGSPGNVYGVVYNGFVKKAMRQD